MKILALVIFAWLGAIAAHSQPNCNLYKWSGDSVCYQACQQYSERLNYAQGSRESQMTFDSVITLCPTFDVAYMEKAVPYLKRGDFITWRVWIDKAVALNPKEHLGYRGWCRYQFLRDYTGALQDLDKLATLKTGNLGYSVNGDYHLNIARALCHKGLGEKEKAKKYIETQLADPTYTPGLYDYLHLAVLHLELGEWPAALSALEKQVVACPNLAENEYYLAHAHRQLGNPDLARKHLLRAKELYDIGRHRTDPYDNPMDRIYLTDIEQALAKQ